MGVEEDCTDTETAHWIWVVAVRALRDLTLACRLTVLKAMDMVRGENQEMRLDCSRTTATAIDPAGDWTSDLRARQAGQMMT